MSLSWMPRENEPKDHSLHRNPHWGTEAPCVIYDKKPLMDPKGMRFRESCDSPEHLQSLALAFWLDVSDSMKGIPADLARKTFPEFAHRVLKIEPDMQILFAANGDAVDGDRAPWQIGQWESSDALADQWLTRIFLEGRGGPKGFESYDLPFYFAARLAKIDCYLKRHRKGYHFMTGDEKPYDRVSATIVNRLLGRTELVHDIPLRQIIAEACEIFHCFFLIPDLVRAEGCEDIWRDYLGDHVIVLEDPTDTAIVAASIVGLNEGVYRDISHLMETLSTEMVDPKVMNRVYRSIRPFAATLGLAGEVRQVNLHTPFSERVSGNGRI